ncbi:MAG: hypothetical protein ABIH55_01240 [Nanoarchaeota archaeon]
MKNLRLEVSEDCEVLSHPLQRDKRHLSFDAMGDETDAAKLLLDVTFSGKRLL